MSKQILLVEDDLDIQRVYGEKLKTEGYEILLAVDAAHGLHHLEHNLPSLILLDIMLPGAMNGFELLEKIKSDQRFQKIPVIVLTNLDTEKDQALKVGAADYLIKAETDLDVLMQKIKGLI